MFPDFDPDEARQRYSIGRTCYFKIMRDRKEILKSAESQSNIKLKQICKTADLEDELHSWISQKNQNGIAVSSSMIRARASEIVPGFNPGPKSKWFIRFKQRYNLVYNKDTKSFIAVKKNESE